MKQNEMAGRRFIGCELDPGYYETARRRIAEAGSDTENPTLEHPPRFGGGTAPSGCSNSEVQK